MVPAVPPTDSPFLSPEVAKAIDHVALGLPPKERKDFSQRVHARLSANPTRPESPVAWAYRVAERQLADDYEAQKKSVESKVDAGADLEQVPGDCRFRPS